MGSLHVDHVTVEFPLGPNTPPVKALSNVDLEIQSGEFVVALGASGCGKSTLLNLLAGFLSPSVGQINLNGGIVVGPGADRAVVFQKHALLPWLNVIDNVAFGLKLRGIAKAERHEIARKHLKQLGLEAFETHPVYQLSGGMQQRVGIARALASDPSGRRVRRRRHCPRKGTRAHHPYLERNIKNGVFYNTQRGRSIVYGHAINRHVAPPRQDYPHI